VLPAKNYPDDPSGTNPRLFYSHRLLTIWIIRISYVSAFCFVVCLVATALTLVRQHQYYSPAGVLLLVVSAVITIIASRNYVYKIEVIGERLLMQTAFSTKEYRMSELKDIYKRSGFQGAFVWLIETSDCKYKFQAKDPLARKFLDKLQSLLPSAASKRWTEFCVSGLNEKRFFWLAAYFLLAGIAGLIFAHATVIGSIYLLFAIVSPFIMRRVALRVKVSEGGLTIVNFLRQEKTVPWQSITSLKRLKTGVILLDSSQGRFSLSAVDGSNILLQQTARNIAPSLFIDELSLPPKLNQKKP
jgi:hypothetical protein